MMTIKPAHKEYIVHWNKNGLVSLYDITRIADQHYNKDTYNILAILKDQHNLSCDDVLVSVRKIVYNLIYSLNDQGIDISDHEAYIVGADIEYDEFLNTITESFDKHKDITITNLRTHGTKIF